MCLRCLYLGIFYFILFNISKCYAQQSDEYKVKTAFIYNLTKMVDWPDNYLATAPFTICFLGEDLFGETLDSLKDKKVHDRPLLLKKNISLNQAEQCHILFINRSEEENMTHILSSIENTSVLTVGDVETFTKQGGIISFFVGDDSRMHIEVNLKVALSKGLKISSKLLALDKVRIVEKQP
ncbi:MAG: hypothetical protein BWK79_08130 [Beggiatoa sp. IS2]|nr:MAG: hypothetical protein BWK79_08130 [Beggiatoa sp. IS2]